MAWYQTEGKKKSVSSLFSVYLIFYHSKLRSNPGQHQTSFYTNCGNPNTAQEEKILPASFSPQLLANKDLEFLVPGNILAGESLDHSLFTNEEVIPWKARRDSL